MTDLYDEYSIWDVRSSGIQPDDECEIKGANKKSKLELKFIDFWDAYSGGIPLDDERSIIEGRKFRFDFIHEASKVAIEINGATWKKGGHSSGTGLARDYEKANLAVLQGWHVFSLSGDMITGEWIGKIADFIRSKTQ